MYITFISSIIPVFLILGMENRCGTCVITFQRSSVTEKSEGTSSQKSDGSSTHLHSFHSVLVLTVGDGIEKLAGPALPQGLTYRL